MTFGKKYLICINCGKMMSKSEAKYVCVDVKKVNENYVEFYGFVCNECYKKRSEIKKVEIDEEIVKEQ